MSNTVEYDGIMGEVNCVYMLADNTHVVLDNACEHGFIVSRVDSISKDEWHVRTIYPSQLKAGTITKAPIKLEDGEVYGFNVNNGARYFGEYLENRKSFFSGENKVCGETEASNIVKLIPEVSNEETNNV